MSNNIDILLNQFLALDDEANQARERADKKKQLLEAAIQSVEPDENGARKFEGTHGKISRSADTVSRRFDATSFKKAQPELHEKFLKETAVKGRFTITRTEV